MKNILLIFVITVSSVSISLAKEKIFNSKEMQKSATFVADGEIISLAEIESKKGVRSCSAKFRVITPFKGDRVKGEIWEIKFKIHPENYEGGRVLPIKVGDKFRIYADNIKI